jgi:hypothetical protein
MHRIRPTPRLACILAGLASALLALAVAAPAALARPRPHLPPGWNKHPPLPPGHVVGRVSKVPVHTALTGGMPGWQITLIAAGAALLAAVLAVLIDRARAARRPATASAASAMTPARPASAAVDVRL